VPRRTDRLLPILGLGPVALVGAVVVGMAVSPPSPASAVPSFAQQTGQPCEECHVGAFGPQLKPYGRDFKLNGYQSTDGKSHAAPIAATIQTSFSHTATDQPPTPGFAPNNNVAVDQVSLYYAGRLPMGWGAFSQVTYDGVGRGFNLDNTDVRHAQVIDLFGQDTIVAVDFNNSPTVEDPWNSTPAWAFPYNQSPFGPTPSATTLIDGGLAGQGIGAGGYVFWNNTLYLDLTAFAPLDRQFAGRLGEGTNGSSDRFIGPIPYGRIAFVHDFDQAQSQTLEVGAYAMRARRFPGGDPSQGADTLSDWALDANYQYIGAARNEVSAHATYIRETQDLKASTILLGTRPTDQLSTARADVSYSLADTWTPSLQAFATTGTTDPVAFGGDPKSSGFVAELAYSPWGKLNSPVNWLNARFAVQYMMYTEFDGDRRHARDNDTLYLNAWIAIAPLGSQVKR